MKYLFAVAFIVVYCLFDTSIGFSSDSAFYTHITYMFQHASIWHLIFNIIGLICISHALQRISLKCQPFIFSAAVLCAFVGSLLAVYEIPTVGFSGALYSMLGGYSICALYLIRLGKIKPHPLAILLSMLVVSNLVGAFVNNSNWLLHTICFVLGALCYTPTIIGAAKMAAKRAGDGSAAASCSSSSPTSSPACNSRNS